MTMTTHEERADKMAASRAQSAQWYAWGAIDNDTTGRYDAVSADDFAKSYRAEALAYGLGSAHFLHGVQDAWLIFTGEMEDWRTVQHSEYGKDRDHGNA